MYLECRHILPSGVRCKSPALRGMSFCYHHESLRRFSSLNSSPEKQPLQLPSIEEPRGIQIALAQILAALASGRIEPRRASLMLYGLQIATQHIVRDTFQENQATHWPPNNPPASLPRTAQPARSKTLAPGISASKCAAARPSAKP